MEFKNKKTHSIVRGGKSRRNGHEVRRGLRGQQSSLHLRGSYNFLRQRWERPKSPPKIPHPGEDQGKGDLFTGILCFLRIYPRPDED